MTLLWKSPDEHPWTRARQREADESRKCMRERMEKLPLLQGLVAQLGKALKGATEQETFNLHDVGSSPTRPIDNDPELNATIDAEQQQPNYNDKNLPE